MRCCRAPLAALLMTSLVSSGCAGLGLGQGRELGTAALVDIDRPELQQFAVASMTDMERDVRIETGSRDGGKKPITPALFWTGIGVGTLGAVGGVAFGVLGYTTKQQLNDGYSGDGLTVEERDDLVKRGEAFNAVALAGSAIAVLGYALAIVTYGADWNRCGPLAPKKRQCPN